MGWNVSALFVHQRSTDDLLGFLADPTYQRIGGIVSADEAWLQQPGGRFYLASDGTWCQLWDPDGRFVSIAGIMSDSTGPGMLTGTRALTVSFSSVTSTYGFALYDDGDIVRSVIYLDGEPVASTGEPLPVEAGIAVPGWGPDEDYLWAVIHAVTGRTSATDQEFEVYVRARPGGPEPAADPTPTRRWRLTRPGRGGGGRNPAR